MNWPDALRKNAGRRPPPLGMLAFGAFVICAITGVLLAPAYRPEAALDSLALLLLKNPAGIFVRSLHYWSAQAFLVFTLAHTVDHMLRRSESRVPFGVWWRLSVTLPVVFAAMLSGFLLRGDGAAVQALHILRSLLNLVPWLGASLTRMLTGSGPDLRTVYLHHACTATIVIWLITVEHARRILPRAQTAAQMLPPLAILSALLIPWLGSRTEAVEKGPWYLVGLQELLHWLPWPQLSLWFGLIVLLLLVLLPLFPLPARTAARRTLAGVAIAYTVLTIAGSGFRGEGWKVTTPATTWTGKTNFVSWRALLPVDPKLLATKVPLITGRREGCMVCHAGMTGFVAAHDPKSLGCVSCHLGNPFTLDRPLAHKGMTLTPGNLSATNRTCGQSNCHSDIATRVQGSLMNTMSGVVAVDKFVFGESTDLNTQENVAEIAHSPADTHLRQLCASCHLGITKEHPGPIDELSRGGGCSACHLRYDASATVELTHRSSELAPLHHPDISIHVSPQACFGCHSRSGRISTNFEGWHETQLDETAAKAKAGWPAQFRILQDGRIFEKHPADVHFAKGMTCVDCHVAAEIMSDGAAHAHEGDAIRIACDDCHAAGATPTREYAQLDGETQQIAAMRRLNEPGRRFVVSQSGAAEYANVFLGPDGRPRVALVESARILIPKPTAAACARSGSMHQRLTCEACHAAWAPQCITCHTSFDSRADGFDYLSAKFVKGAWQEEAAELDGDAPALGVERVAAPDGKTVERVTTFAPGMIIDLRLPAGARTETRALRLYAPVSPHTTASQARNCRSCHANPSALGYGRGTLQYVVGEDNGAWRFIPAHGASLADGLPQDAWTGFLREPQPNATTREGARPFTLQEQRCILLVGACLACHTGNEPRVAAALAHFPNYRSSLSPRCKLPVWANAALDKQLVQFSKEP